MWDLATRDLEHQIDTNPTVELADEKGFVNAPGVAFIDDGTRIKAAMPSDAMLEILTLDTDELLDISRSRVTRGFTDTECVTYHIDPCATLEEIRAG